MSLVGVNMGDFLKVHEFHFFDPVMNSTLLSDSFGLGLCCWMENWTPVKIMSVTVVPHSELCEQ